AGLAGQVGGEPGQLLPGSRGMRLAHPPGVLVRRQPALRERLAQYADGGITVGARGQRDRVHGLRPGQVRAVVLKAHRSHHLEIIMTDYPVIKIPVHGSVNCFLPTASDNLSLTILCDNLRLSIWKPWMPARSRRR